LATIKHSVGAGASLRLAKFAIAARC
jgi:hypothetical protein